MNMKCEHDFSSAKRGALLDATGKTRIIVYLDDDVVRAFRSRAEASGYGLQTAINDALKASIANLGNPG